MRSNAGSASASGPCEFVVIASGYRADLARDRKWLTPFDIILRSVYPLAKPLPGLEGDVPPLGTTRFRDSPQPNDCQSRRVTSCCRRPESPCRQAAAVICAADALVPTSAERGVGWNSH